MSLTNWEPEDYGDSVTFADIGVGNFIGLVFLPLSYPQSLNRVLS
jgi:hypothetical protein